MNVTEWEAGLIQNLVYLNKNQKIFVTISIYHHRVEVDIDAYVEKTLDEHKVGEAFTEYSVDSGSEDCHIGSGTDECMRAAAVIQTYDMPMEQQQFDKVTEHIKRLDRVFNKIGFYTGDSK